MRYQTAYILHRIKVWIATVPLWLIYRWPVGIVALVGCGFYPLAGVGLAIWYIALSWWALRNPSGSTGNCAGAFGDAAVIFGGVFGAVLCAIAAIIGAIF